MVTCFAQFAMMLRCIVSIITAANHGSGCHGVLGSCSVGTLGSNTLIRWDKRLSLNQLITKSVKRFTQSLSIK